MPPKRASAANADADAPVRKRGRTSSADAAAKALVADIIDASENYELPENDDNIAATVKQLARYARSLEEQLASADKAAAQAPAAPAQKTPEQLAVAAEKIRKAAVAGIKKQMSWKPSCKTNSAKFVYDGVCADPEVFGYLFKLGGPPKWKMKKYTREEFEDLFGEVKGAVRYNALYISSGGVNVRWSETGEFKLSGSYGISRSV
ncbi:hypothetical protein PsYK624_084590 [Phanerochaete sordida]|uniref:Uncharacterized protein n=1 Tax=Phanerochaete sordida TaxID=48140 RepID=A0A9P3LEJ1_9APHY|nr:hypothetical protein PsYK624_084590 [Phanerochaete sordida]